ncbi:MAG: asparaginase domain-containing protein [Planctomycetota bacterium]|jgi:L-asparaginase
MELSWRSTITARIRIITTGGTIAKIYNEADGSLIPQSPVIESILRGLRLPDLEVQYQHLLLKDSLDFTDQDRTMILLAVRSAQEECDGVLLIHGTDTLEITGEMLHDNIPEPQAPVVITGAMRPFEFRDSDATQNVTEALLVSRMVEPGIYVAMHNRVLKFPGVVKDRSALAFVKSAQRSG